MDKQEAKLVLQALRPQDLNTAQPDVIEALVFVEHDPELKAWWEAQQAFDRRVVAKLKELPLPSDLRATLLAGRKIEQFPPQASPPHFAFWLAAAAVLAILCVTGTFWRISPAASGLLARTEYVAAIVPMLNHDAPALGMTSPDHDKIMAWLKERNAPTGTLPPTMTALPTVGCQNFTVQGHAVSLICFALAGGGLAHLFIVDEHALADPPADNVPDFKPVQGWSTASWSDGRMSYMLATQAGSDALKQLL